MREKRNVQVCENPDCGASHDEFQGLDAHGVYVDRGWRHLAGSGGFAKVYACSWECIGPAMKAAAQEAWDTMRIRERW